MAECDGQRQAVYGRLLMEPGEPTYTFDSSSHRVEFLQYTVKPEGRLVGTQGITGSLTQLNDRLITGVSPLKGVLRMNVSPADFGHLLPKLTGGTFNAGVITFADSVPYFGILFDAVGEIYTDESLKVSRWWLEGQSPTSDNEEASPLVLTMELLGKTRTGGGSWPGSPPAWGTGLAAQKLGMRHGALTIQAEDRSASIQWFRLSCDYGLTGRYGMGSLGFQSICPSRRMLRLQAIADWSDANEELVTEDADGTAATLAFTNGTVSESLAISNLHFPASGVGIERRGPMEINLDGIITGTASGSPPTEITWTHDETAS